MDRRAMDILESMTDGFIGLDRQGRIAYVNAPGERILRRCRQDVMDRSIWEVFPDAIGGVFHREYERALASGEPTSFENHYLPYDGWYEVRVHPSSEGVSIYLRDITDQKRREEALRLSEALAYGQLAEIDAIYNSVPIGLCVLDRGLRFLRVNDRFAELNGVPAKEHIGRTVRDIVPDLGDLSEELAERVIATGEAIMNMEASGTTLAAPGVERVWRERWMPLKDSSGQVVAINIVAEEITAQKRAEVDQRRYLSLQRALVAASAKVLACQDIGGLLQTVAEVAREITSARLALSGRGYVDNRFTVGGISRAPDLPPSLGDRTFYMEKGGVFLDLLEAATLRLTDRELKGHLHWWGLPDGHVPLCGLLACRLTARDGSLTGLIAVSHREEGDFTEEDEAALSQLANIASLALQNLEARAETEARAAEALARGEELARSNRDLEQYAYVASHDLKEPLRMVTGFLDLFCRGYYDALDERGKQFVDFAVEGGERMQRLVDDLLAYSRAGKAKELCPIDLQEVLGRVLANLQASIQETGACITCDSLPMVLGDPMELMQVLQNLIANALKFRGQGRPEIHVGARPREDHWVLSVRDNGIGIEPRYAHRLFQIFQRLHTQEEYPGTGIGLAICKKIVESRGGAIWFDSSPGQGAAFFFTLLGQA